MDCDVHLIVKLITSDRALPTDTISSQFDDFNNPHQSQSLDSNHFESIRQNDVTQLNVTRWYRFLHEIFSTLYSNPLQFEISNISRTIHSNRSLKGCCTADKFNPSNFFFPTLENVKQVDNFASIEHIFWNDPLKMKHFFTIASNKWIWKWKKMNSRKIIISFIFFGLTATVLFVYGVNAFQKSSWNCFFPTQGNWRSCEYWFCINRQSFRINRRLITTACGFGMKKKVSFIIFTECFSVDVLFSQITHLGLIGGKFKKFDDERVLLRDRKKRKKKRKEEGRMVECTGKWCTSVWRAQWKSTRHKLRRWLQHKGSNYAAL